VFLILGACVKRAQFPFNSWLLAAISAPTPISSLVHSSTLVVAGVYVLLQYSYCLTDFLDLLRVIRVLRLVVRRFGLLNEFDIKKLIAYSTIRHVSLIINLLRFKLYKIVYFHLNIHAIFKSLMFICFGFVMLCSFHRQDKRLVSFLAINPLVKIIFYFSCLCLGGLPFISAFFSKDLIIEKFMEFNNEFIYVFLLLIFLRVRVYYRIKLLKLRYLINSLIIVDKSYIGIFRVLFISFIILRIINLFIRLVFRVTLEVIQFKLIIYLFIFIFLLLSLLSNLNYKIFFYDKIKNFAELWNIDYCSLDKFLFWNLYNRIYYFNIIRMLKLFLIIN